jgi:hypothetical protein
VREQHLFTLEEAVRKMMKAFVAMFVVLEAVAALGLIVVSVHGPSGLAAAACAYFVIAAGLTWWAGRRLASALVLIAVGVALLAAAPGLFATLGQLENFRYARRIAATRVSDVRDEPIVSSTSGRPIRVRLSYTVTVPQRGYFAILPSLSARDARSERLSLNAVRWTIDGRSDPIPFDPGKTHAMVVELYPPILFFRRDERCLATVLVPPLPASGAAAPLRAMISETTYGNVYNGGAERLTNGSYDLGELYRGVLAEGLKACEERKA